MDFSSKKWPRADLITKNRRFLFVKSSGHFFFGKPVLQIEASLVSKRRIMFSFWNLSIYSWNILIYSWNIPIWVRKPYPRKLWGCPRTNIFLEYPNMFLEYSKWGRSDDEHPKWARPPTKFTHPGKNKCVSIPSLQTYSPP